MIYQRKDRKQTRCASQTQLHIPSNGRKQNTVRCASQPQLHIPRKYRKTDKTGKQNKCRNHPVHRPSPLAPYSSSTQNSRFWNFLVLAGTHHAYSAEPFQMTWMGFRIRERPRRRHPRELHFGCKRIRPMTQLKKLLLYCQRRLHSFDLEALPLKN